MARQLAEPNVKKKQQQIKYVRVFADKWHLISLKYQSTW